MTGILVQLAISWLIIYLVEKKDLSVLGLIPGRRRLTDFIVFFLITSACCASGFLMKMYFGSQRWVLNPDISPDLILNGIWWNIKSVLFEELIFRGVLLYILIKRMGATIAIIISAIAFGIYHWFSFGAFGNPLQMLIIFLITGIMGLILAYGYAKTYALYLPIGIHLGWNLTQIFIFSDGPIGKGLLVPNSPGPFMTDSYFIFFMVTFLPMLLSFVINYMLIRKHHQVIRDI